MTLLPVIAVPGWLHTAECFAPLRAQLAATAGVGRLTLLDGLPSAPPPDDAQLDAVLQSHSGCVMVGWSLGALRCLAATLRQPASVRALVLMAPTVRFTADAASGYPGASTVALRAMRRRLRTDPQGCAADFLKACHAPRPVSPETLAQAAARAAGQGSAATRDAGLAWLAETDLRDRLDELSMPLCLLHGTEDGIVPAAQSAWMAERVPHARRLAFRGVGHFPDDTLWTAAARAVAEVEAGLRLDKVW